MMNWKTDGRGRRANEMKPRVRNREEQVRGLGQARMGKGERKTPCPEYCVSV